MAYQEATPSVAVVNRAYGEPTMRLAVLGSAGLRADSATSAGSVAVMSNARNLDPAACAATPSSSSRTFCAIWIGRGSSVAPAFARAGAIHCLAFRMMRAAASPCQRRRRAWGVECRYARFPERGHRNGRCLLVVRANTRGRCWRTSGFAREGNCDGGRRAGANTRSIRRRPCGRTRRAALPIWPSRRPRDPAADTPRVSDGARVQVFIDSPPRQE